jgi:hypothetical protein
MENEDFYTQWKEHRQQVQVPEDFSSSVMAAIESQAPGEGDELPTGITDFSSRIMRWAAAAGLMLLGIGRIVFITVNLLRANPLVPY